MPSLASGLDFVDVRFLDRPGLIATGVLHGSAGVAVVDPGPSTTLGRLTGELDRKGIRFADVRHILLTHIHLDHAGVTGTLVERWPHLEVIVHERGAPHLADPSRLLSSAGRLYGAEMDALWGEVRPVPADRIRSVGEGDTLNVAGRELQVAYTPGHASHHVSYLDVGSRVAFVGDTAGIRRPNSDFVMPATPPPDIDLETWRKSTERILRWEPDTLFLTHFGPVQGARQHFEAMFEHTETWSRMVRRLLARTDLSDAERQQQFTDEAFLSFAGRWGTRRRSIM